jgi:glycosyltransferase involved in cell wall biosynthesis
MPDDPVVSVIIPVYNDPRGIDRCVGALGAQDYPREKLDVIVVDNGSEVPVKIDSGYADFVRVVSCSTPGSYAARNAGVRHARGDFLAFTDGDCMPDRSWIAACLEAFRGSDSNTIVGGEVCLDLSDFPSTVEKYQFLTGFNQKENIKKRGFSVTANLFASQSQMTQIGPFDESLLSGGDLEWCWRARTMGFSLEYSPKAIVRTSPRISLAAAIQQARRVAGGRRHLGLGDYDHVGQNGVAGHRSGLAAVNWILTHPDLSWLARLQILGIASILRLVTIMEAIRLRFGANPERL